MMRKTEDQIKCEQEERIQMLKRLHFGGSNETARLAEQKMAEYFSKIHNKPEIRNNDTDLDIINQIRELLPTLKKYFSLQKILESRGYSVSVDFVQGDIEISKETKFNFKV